MQRDRQLDDAETGAQMTAGDGDGVDRFLAQLGCDLTELVGGKPPQVARPLNRVEERRFRL
jgi:hypothetical protein